MSVNPSNNPSSQLVKEKYEQRICDLKEVHSKQMASLKEDARAWEIRWA
jgi:hypothetical protein